MKHINFKDSRNSLYDYFKWRKIRSQIAIQRVEKIINLKGLEVLDFGCGYGSLMANLIEIGAMVTGCEIDQASIDLTRKFLKRKRNYQLVKVDNYLVPFKENTFDVVFLFDVIEHVRDPKKVINECKRVLKPGGIMYVEFTPYYSIVGHHLYDYTKLPIHILPKSIIKKIIFSKKIPGIFTPDQYWEVFLSLNKLKINTFQKFIRGFEIIEEKFIIKYPNLFEINIPFFNLLGPFKDFLTLSFQGVYLKKL